VVLNHLGFCPHRMRVDRHGRPAFHEPFPPGSLDPVLRLAEHPEVRVMLSGQYALSREEPPYRDLAPIVRALFDGFGPQRMLWASDYPWTRDVPGYGTLLELAEQALPDASASDLAAIHGGTALELFPHLRTAEVT
jgi:L-fuconolactonase